VIDFNGQRYSTTSWYEENSIRIIRGFFFIIIFREKNKQLAEQGSAIVCLQSIGIDPTRAKYGINYLKTCLVTDNKS